MVMAGLPQNNIDLIIYKRVLTGIAELHAWRIKQNLETPSNQLWWDDQYSFYKGRYSGWSCCSVCGPIDDPSSVSLHMDHCHKTGLYRGLLCQNCNVSEGKWGKEWWTAWRIAAPNLLIGRRRIHSYERYTRSIENQVLMNAPMSSLLKLVNLYMSHDGRLTNSFYA